MQDAFPALKGFLGSQAAKLPTPRRGSLPFFERHGSDWAGPISPFEWGGVLIPTGYKSFNGFDKHADASETSPL
jgi:hypothetical protein